MVIVVMGISTRFGLQLGGVMGLTTVANLSRCRYNAEMTSATCSDSGLKSIPEIPETALTLDLSFNNIATIPTRAFSKLSKLQSLNLKSNQIRLVEPFAFDGLQNLTTLYLGQNDIQTLGNRSFANIPLLNYLDLIRNSIEKIATDAFTGTSSISEIFLHGNVLSEVPSIGHQPLLNRLDLSDNYIVNATFPSTYSNNKNNISVSLYDNVIETLDKFTFSSLAGTSIVDMLLSLNNITAVAPSTFDQFKAIENLYLGSNPLSIESLENIAHSSRRKHVTFIDLSYTLRTSEMLQIGISAFMGLGIRLGMCATLCKFERFKNLTILQLTKDEVVQFSELQFPGKKNLLAIDLARNEFSSFPQFLPTSLESIDLGRNQIISLHKNEISYLENLKLLVLSRNDISFVSQDAFNGLGNLQVLDLAQNRVFGLYGNVFEPLQNLTHLYLGSNRLVYIKSPGISNTLVSLRFLDLSDNGLATVENPFSESFPSLQILHLERNNLSEYFVPSDRGVGLFSGLTELEEIFISSNNIQNIPNLILRDQVSLTLLDISNNQISGWGPDVFNFTKNIEKLDVSFNKISALTDRNLHDLNNLQELNLKGNPFICNCDLLWFREWIDSTSVALPDKESYTCHGPEEWRGKLVLEFTKDTINCTFISVFAIVGSVAIAIFVSVVFGVCVYKNRWRIDLRLYLLSKRGRHFLDNVCRNVQQQEFRAINENDREYIYDAYISCSDQDYDWVLDHLLPDIDNGRYDDNEFGGDFKLYYDPRDQEPGNVLDMPIAHFTMTINLETIIIVTLYPRS